MPTTSRLRTKADAEAVNNPTVPWTTTEVAVEVLADAVGTGATSSGATTDTPSTAVEDATARTGISLWKGIKNYLRDLATNIAVASGVADAGNPLKIGGRYNSTPPTLTNGQRGDAQLSLRGHLKTQISGIDSDGTTPRDATLFRPNVDLLSQNVDILMVGGVGMASNGTSLDRLRSNTSIVLLASAARTTTQTSADITNYNGRMLRVGLDMTVVGTGSVTLSIEEKDANGIYRTLLASAAITTNIYTPLTIFPGATVTANVSANDFVPRTFRIVVTANNANSATYSVAYVINI